MLKMEIIYTEMNRGNKCTVFDGFTCRFSHTLKVEDIVYDRERIESENRDVLKISQKKYLDLI